MRIQAVDSVGFYGLGSKVGALARSRDNQARKTICEAAEKRHPDDRSTYIKEHWNKYLEERSQATMGRGVDMEKVLEPTEHDKKMNRLRGRR